MITPDAPLVPQIPPPGSVSPLPPPPYKAGAPDEDAREPGTFAVAPAPLEKGKPQR